LPLWREGGKEGEKGKGEIKGEDEEGERKGSYCTAQQH
jgi:hypothetical protein